MDHLDDLQIDPNLRIWNIVQNLYRICLIQGTRPKKIVDHAGYTTPTRQHEADN